MRALGIAMLSVATCLGAAQITGCASDGSSRATGQVVDDSAITARVKTALVREAGFSEAMDVNVDTYRGVVQLSGFVESQQQASRAQQIAQGVEGVQSVKNDLRVASPRR